MTDCLGRLVVYSTIDRCHNPTGRAYFHVLLLDPEVEEEIGEERI